MTDEKKDAIPAWKALHQSIFDWCRDCCPSPLESDIDELINIVRPQPVADDAGGDAVAEWVKAQPHETYDGLKRQFYSLKCMLNSIGTQLSFYQKKSYETGEQHLAALQESLDSERAMNATLTAELEAKTTSAPAEPEAEGDALKHFDNELECAKKERSDAGFPEIVISYSEYALYQEAVNSHRAALSKPPAQPDKDLVAVNHELTWGDRGGGMYWQARCCNFTTIGNGGPYNTAEEAKEAARHGCNRMIAQTDKTGVV